MRKVSVIHYPLDAHDFGALSKTERSPRARTRLLVLHQFSIGLSYQLIAENNALSVTTTLRIRRDYWREGLSSIYDKPRSGRRSKLPPEHYESFKMRIVQSQLEKKGGRLRGEDIAETLRKHYGVEYHPDAIYNLLQRIGMSWISGRSRHPKADIKKQEAFKKNL